MMTFLPGFDYWLEATNDREVQRTTNKNKKRYSKQTIAAVVKRLRAMQQQNKASKNN